MDQATAARHRLEAMETRAYPLCRTATLRRRPGPGGANRRQPTWPLAAQQQSRAHPCPTKCLLHLARLCSPRGSQATLIYRTAVYGPVCTVVWEGEAARPTPIPILFRGRISRLRPPSWTAKGPRESNHALAGKPEDFDFIEFYDDIEPTCVSLPHLPKAGLC